MAANEVLKTSGDIRRFIAQTMVEVKSGELSVDKGQTIAQLAKELTSSMQAEVNAAKVKLAMEQAGKNLGKITHMGKMVIDDAGSIPTLDGTK